MLRMINETTCKHRFDGGQKEKGNKRDCEILRRQGMIAQTMFEFVFLFHRAVRWGHSERCALVTSVKDMNSIPEPPER